MTVYIYKTFLIWVCLLSYFLSVSADCPNGFIRHDDSCYVYVTNIKATWVEAQMYCKLFKSYLATIENEREEMFLEGLLLREVNNTVTTDIVWLGATDAVIDGEWKWVETGVDIIPGQVYTKWYPGEPSIQSRNHQEDCLNLFRKESFMWNDSDCSKMSNFICERSRSSPPMQPPQIIGK